METTLNSSMANAYSVQRISWFSSTRVRRYNRRSSGRSTGIEKCAFPVEHPRHEDAQRLGDRENHSQVITICNQPFAVILRTSPAATVRRADRPSSRAHDQHDDRFSIHDISP